MGELKFASVNDAIQHLSNVTQRRVKIAWEDESRDMVKAIADSIRKKPALLVGLKKKNLLNVDQALQNAGVDADAKILPSSRGNLKIVDDVPEDAIESVAQQIAQTKDLASRGKIIDHAVESGDFDAFDDSYPKGVDKDDKGPYYRSKAGLLQKGAEAISGEAGEEGSKDKVDRKKLEGEAKSKKNEHKEDVMSVAKKAGSKIKALPKSKAKTMFEYLLDKPANPVFQKKFMDAFKADVENKKVSAEDAGVFLDIVEDMAQMAEDQFAKDLPEFAKSLKLLVPKVDKIEDKAAPAAEGAEPVGDMDVQEESGLVDQFGRPLRRSEEMDAAISNILDEWVGKNLS
jgi:hypothetical protein